MTDRIKQLWRPRLKLRENVFESERLKQWHTRENLKHRFANGTQIEIQWKP